MFDQISIETEMEPKGAGAPVALSGPFRGFAPFKQTFTTIRPPTERTRRVGGSGLHPKPGIHHSFLGNVGLKLERPVASNPRKCRFKDLLEPDLENVGLKFK